MKLVSPEKQEGEITLNGNAENDQNTNKWQY